MAQATSRIAQERPSLVFLCNPNNPTGVFLDSPEVQTLVQAVAGVGGLLVIDEAYISFVDNPWDSLGLALRGNAVVVRSMTKDYALTGLRLGYALAPEEVIARLSAFQPDWSVNGLAQAAGLAALSDTGYLPRARQAVAQAKEYLAHRLTSLGLTVHPSTANFLLVHVANAGLWRGQLMRRGFFVRDCTSFGLPEHIRVGIRPMEDCRRLADAMEEVSGQG
jgi:histidinol-phosphate aminotransferase